MANLPGSFHKPSVAGLWCAPFSPYVRQTLAWGKPADSVCEESTKIFPILAGNPVVVMVRQKQKPWQLLVQSPEAVAWPVRRMLRYCKRMLISSPSTMAEQ
jgi:hypothetical protein